MRKFILISILLIISTIFSGCKKENDMSCDNLKNALVEKNTDNIKSALQEKINQMNSQLYNEENLNRFASTISNCGVNANLLCYDCIMTLPAESEMKISYSRFGMEYQVIVDILPDNSNRIHLQGIHD